MADPGIDIRPGESGLEIVQHRPNVTSLLTGMPLAEAMQRIPSLLPICGNAQGIAAERAAAAARGEAEHHSKKHRQLLNREQALAAAWRLAIDWPALCGRPPVMDALKEIQRSQDSHSLAIGLTVFLPGLGRVGDIDALLAWVEESDCLAAGLVREALSQEAAPGADSPTEGDHALCADDSLVTLARDAFGAEPFLPLEPRGAGIEVGPLAMGRHPLVADVLSSERFGKLSRRLVAQLLDTLAIVRALSDQSPDDQSGESPEGIDNAWRQGEGIGIGRAITARGPVFHRVRLVEEDDGPRVADWRVLAPTDWHFAPGGPLSRAFTDADATTSSRKARSLELLVAGFDPCAPWTIRGGEASHA